LPTALRWIAYPILFLAGLALIGIALLAIIVILAYPQLPSLEVLTDYQPKIPLRIYTADGHLIGEFGEERRALAHIRDVPQAMKQAILAAEDERFYQHPGVDTLGVLRAAYANFTGGGKRQGASTITMQVARNFFLSREKTFSRKVYEALLAFKIENNLSKDEILEIYINQIYLGQRAYGFAAAAQIYYGKTLNRSHWQKPPCWPACRKRLPASTPLPTRKGQSCANTMSCGACVSWVSSMTLNWLKHRNRICISSVM